MSEHISQNNDGLKPKGEKDSLLPPSVLLRHAIDEKISYLGPIVLEQQKATNKTVGDSDGFVGFHNKKIPVKIGEIDQVEVSDLLREADGTVTMGLHLFSDGSPYELEGANPAYPHKHYDLVVVNGEYPPFIADLEQVDRGDNAYTKNDVPAYLRYLRGLQGEIVTHSGESVDPPLLLSNEECMRIIDEVLPQLDVDLIDPLS